MSGRAMLGYSNLRYMVLTVTAAFGEFPAPYFYLNINVRFLKGPRDLGRLWLGPWPFRFSGGFVLPYRWFALGAGFGRYVWRWFRLILSLVRVMFWFWTFRFRGSFVLSYRWFVLGAGCGRSVWRRFRLIL